jgi:hypothetical protein
MPSLRRLDHDRAFELENIFRLKQVFPTSTERESNSSHYANTMQETCLKLMGKKLLVSLAMEGKFSSEGLQAIDESDDILMAMARELVTQKGIGERADAVWAALQRKQEESLGVISAEDAAQPISTPTLVLGPQWTPVPSVKPPARNTQRIVLPDGQLTLF